MRALLGYRGVVNDQHGIAATNELIRLNQQFCLHRFGVPDPGRDEVSWSFKSKYRFYLALRGLKAQFFLIFPPRGL